MRRPSALDLQFIGSLAIRRPHLKQIPSDYANKHNDRPVSVLMLIGPEGDFHPPPS